MVVPEINADHVEIIPAQRKRLGTRRGFIAVKSNCSLQSYVPALHPLRGYGITDVLVCTYQAISGAGKTFETFPEIVDNVIPYIGGEEEKSEQEPLKLWGRIEGDRIVSADSPPLHRTVPAGAGVRRTYGRGLCALCPQALAGGDPAGMEGFPRPCAGVGAAQRTEAIPALF